MVMRPAGTITNAGMPACAPYAASDELVLPVDAHAIAVAPQRFACVTATVMPRSLNEPDGLNPSCFINKFFTPANFEIAGRSSNGVLPSGWLTMSASLIGRTSSRNLHTPERPAADPRIAAMLTRLSKRFCNSSLHRAGMAGVISSRPPHLEHVASAVRSLNFSPHVAHAIVIPVLFMLSLMKSPRAINHSTRLPQSRRVRRQDQK